MAQRMLSFIHRRAPRAAGLSDEAIDEHKDLIRELYLARKYSRDQVIIHLKTELDFKLSPDQFSKAIRRWGFRKQFHSGRSIQQPPNETASPYAATNTPSNDLSCITDGEHPTTAPDPCPLPCPPAKRPKPISDLNDIIAPSPWHSRVDPDIDGDGDITLSSPTAEKSTKPSLSHQSTEDYKLSAEYLACCYHYTKAFSCYSTISIPFGDKIHSAKERRARMLDMARVATTRRNCEVVRLMLEDELERSNDPLAEEGHNRSSLEEAEICRMHSFLFHRHLAQIYARQNDGAISMQKHLDNTRNFTKTFDTHGTESIDLWALLFFVQDKNDSQIPEELLGSLQWDYESYRLNIDHCLLYCWGILKPTVSLHEASRRYDAGQRAVTEPTDMSDLTLQNSPVRLWTRSSILFTFLWKEIQLTHGTLPWESGHPTISPAHILLIVSRIIVKRSCLTSKHNDDLQEEHQVNIHPASLQLYCDALLGLFHDNLFAPDETKREFVTQFVEHHTWSPPLDSQRSLTSQTQSYQIEALESLLASKRDGVTFNRLNRTTEEWTNLFKKASENRRASTGNDFSKWLEEHQGQQRLFTGLGNAGTRFSIGMYPPPISNSSCLTASVSSHRTYSVALYGNPAISKPLASHSSCSSQRSYSSSLQRFKSAALSRQHQPKLTMALSENSDVLMDEDFLGNL
ncbi:uncharacterized protein FTOL_05254 [Fusarium torulosum]|uniref:Clr5 domain-containing protein n=1 Tax=Fusarium torulosum TaxID=33205 RepID=A0AAE8SH15_9HYPO|nr:uncharacterized protein FTOL_05254 [Fusarium torulosum]